MNRNSTKDVNLLFEHVFAKEIYEICATAKAVLEDRGEDVNTSEYDKWEAFDNYMKKNFPNGYDRGSSKATR